MELIWSKLFLHGLILKFIKNDYAKQLWTIYLLEYQKYKHSYCIEDGFQGHTMLHKIEATNDNYIEYALPEISVIPPIETESCHIDLYRNGNEYVDRFYISKNKQPTSQLKRWTIRHSADLESSKYTEVYAGKGSINLIYKMDHYKISLKSPFVGTPDLSRPKGKTQN